MKIPTSTCWHIIWFYKIVYLLRALQWKQTKKIIPDNQHQQKNGWLIFSLLSSTFFISLSSLDSYLSLTPFNLLSVFVRVYSIDGKFRSLHWRAIPQRRTRRKKIENLCVVYDCVLSYFCCAHRALKNGSNWWHYLFNDLRVPFHRRKSIAIAVVVVVVVSERDRRIPIWKLIEILRKPFVVRNRKWLKFIWMEWNDYGTRCTTADGDRDRMSKSNWKRVTVEAHYRNTPRSQCIHI